MAEQVSAGEVYVDGSGIGDVGPKVMAEREILGRDGFVIALVPVSAATGEVAGKPELISRGFVYVRESGDLLDRAADRAYSALRVTNIRKRQTIVERTQDALTRFLFDETGRKPMVVAVVTEK